MVRAVHASPDEGVARPAAWKLAILIGQDGLDSMALVTR